jgi:ADP-heptose:LPS heptosyltransferase
VSRSVLRPQPASIAVVRALQLGDMLCVVPALRALRAACPQSRITLVGLPWARDFARRFSAYIDDFVAFPGFPGLPERACDAPAVPGFLRAMQERRFDLALQLHGSGRVMNAVTALMGARRTAGFCDAAAPLPAEGHFIRWREDEHEVLRYLRLLAWLGAPPRGTGLEFPPEPDDGPAWAELARQTGLAGRPYVCIHPGAQLPSRRWPPQRFAEVADRIAGLGYAVAVTGTAGEATLTSAAVAAMSSPAADLAGRTTLGSLAVLVRHARLVVCNDTGLSHIAAAVRTPSVVVSCGSDPRRWAPLDAARHRVLHHPIACRPCSHAVCPIGHPCAEGVRAADVFEEARRLLAPPGDAPHQPDPRPGRPDTESECVR